MTRINAGIPVRSLTREHLQAEHREIKRIPNKVRTGKAKLDNIPDTFRLGTGHVRFFYNKLGYLLKRYRQLYEEGLRRGIRFTDFSSAWDGIPQELMQDWQPSKEDAALVQARINERLKN